MKGKITQLEAQSGLATMLGAVVEKHLGNFFFFFFFFFPFFFLFQQDPATNAVVAAVQAKRAQG
jgi:hypothetical protein